MDPLQDHLLLDQEITEPQQDLPLLDQEIMDLQPDLPLPVREITEIQPDHQALPQKVIQQGLQVIHREAHLLDHLDHLKVVQKADQEVVDVDN